MLVDFDKEDIGTIAVGVCKDSDVDKVLEKLNKGFEEQKYFAEKTELFKGE